MIGMGSGIKYMEETTYKTYLKKTKKPILIYGAGIVAYYFAYELMQDETYRDLFVGFVVGNPKDDVSNYWGKPVLGVSRYEKDKDNYRLIVATKENVWSQIESCLKERGWRDYYFLSTCEYERIRSEYPQLTESEYMIGQFERIRMVFGRLENAVYRMNSLIDNSIEKYGYVDNGRDRNGYLDDFRKFRQGDIYTQEVQELLSGLGVEDVQTICQIVDRLNRLCNNMPILYTLEEKHELEKIKNDFDLKKYKISDTLYMYKNYKLPIDHFEVSVFWYRHGIDLLENLDEIKNKCLIDAGGFIGDSALVLSEYWEGKIYSFEADPDNFSCLKETIRLNNLKKVIPVNLALTDKNEKINLYRTLGSSSSTIEKENRFSPVQKNPIQIKGVMIDSIVEEYGLSVGLIKTDVEGAEKCLLKGAEKTIKSQKPDLIISIYHSIDDFFHIKKQIENLDVGYRFKLFRPILEDSFLLETCLVCEAV